MPPVADDENQWKKAVDGALAANASKPGRPASLRKLSSTLATMRGSTQKEDSWKRSLNKIRAGTAPTERQAKLIASALGVAREELPAAASPPLKPSDVSARLQELSTMLAVVMAEQKEMDARLVALEARGKPTANAPTSQARS